MRGVLLDRRAEDNGQQICEKKQEIRNEPDLSCNEREGDRDGGAHNNSKRIKKMLTPPLTSPLYFLQLLTEHGQMLLGMVDSGAEMNIIGGKLVKKLNCATIKRPAVRVNGSGGSIVVNDFIRVPLILTNGHPIEIIAGVVPSFGTALILGAPFLHMTKGNIDYEGHLFTTYYGIVPCVFAPDLEQSNATCEIHIADVKPEKLKKKESDKQGLNDKDAGTLVKIMEGAFLTENQKRDLRDVLIDSGELWKNDPQGRTGILRHQIKVTTQRPIRQKPRRFPPEQSKLIEENIKEMLDKNIIRHSNSPHAHEVVLVKKKDGKWRFCIDYRRLNDVTISDEFPLPRIQDLIRNIQDSKYFITLDLRAGYWQILMDENSIPLTAFRAHHNLYEYIVMPFGLKTAPATFSRLMEDVLGDLYWRGVCVYLDDILIHHVDFEGAMDLLKIVLQRLKKAGLTIAIDKCRFFPKELLYLGYIVGDGYIKPNLEKIETLRRLKVPKDVKGVRSLLGCIGYFRQFIPRYSEIAEPLLRLLKKKNRFQWSEEQEQAKNTLIEALMDITLTNPLNGDLLKLETDASDLAISAILYCRATNRDPWRPVEFVSRTLNEVQQRWPIHEREAFAIVYALERLDPYLRGRDFEVWTDSSSITWMNNSKTGKVARWASRLAEYKMKLIFRSGKTNVVADFLSRYLEDSPDEFLPERAIALPTTVAEGVAKSLRDENYWLRELKTTWNLAKSGDNSVLRMEQILQRQKEEVPPQGHSYQFKKGVIFHFNKIWVPPSLRFPLIERVHHSTAYHHPGVRRTVGLIRKVFSWPGVQVDVARYIRSCLNCQRLRPGLEGLQGNITPHTTPGAPFTHIYMDTYKFTLDNTHYTFLTILDLHTRWAEAQLINEVGAQGVASIFIKNWIARYGCPISVVTDSETILSGSVMRNLCEILGIKLIRTIAHHPDGNAPVESFHRVLHKGLQHFAMKPRTLHLTVDEIIQLTLLGYRSSFHLSTRETPAYLTFGIDLRPPRASLFRRNNPKDTERIQILNDIREAVVQNAYLRKIREQIKKQGSRIEVQLQVGDLVLLPIERAEAAFHTISHKGRKFMPKYTMPYRVLQVLNKSQGVKCKNLVPVTGIGLPGVCEVREASIQDIRKIYRPLTQRQLLDWKEVLKSYLEEFPLSNDIREKLYQEFWTELTEPQAYEGREGRIKRQRVRNN